MYFMAGSIKMLFHVWLAHIQAFMVYNWNCRFFKVFAISGYPLESQIKAEGGHVSINAAYTFTKTGTYFPVLLVASQRDGDTKTPFTRIYNLARVRGVVK